MVFKKFSIPDRDLHHNAVLDVSTGWRHIYVEAGWMQDRKHYPDGDYPSVLMCYSRRQALRVAWALIVCVVQSVRIFK